MDKFIADKLDYFAAHAPAMPVWFKTEDAPDKPHKPNDYPSQFGKGSGYKYKDIVAIHYNDDAGEFMDDFETKVPVDIRDVIKADFDKWDSDFDKYFETYPAWEAINKLKAMTNWRFTYAYYMAQMSDACHEPSGAVMPKVSFT